MIRDRIICGINSERLQARLFRGETLTLEKATSLCKADQASRKQLKDLTKESNVNIDSLEKNAKKRGVEKKKWKQRQDKPRIPPNLPNKLCGTVINTIPRDNVRHTEKLAVHTENQITLKDAVARRMYTVWMNRVKQILTSYL